jgi:hypothetical protein
MRKLILLAALLATSSAQASDAYVGLWANEQQSCYGSGAAQLLQIRPKQMKGDGYACALGSVRLQPSEMAWKVTAKCGSRTRHLAFSRDTANQTLTIDDLDDDNAQRQIYARCPWD